MSERTSKRVSNQTPNLHSWDLCSWPEGVWPMDRRRARWVLRAYRRELLEEGALARAGKSLIVLARGYERWLAKRAAHVPGYVSNNPRMRSSNADVSL